jgi:predicted RNA-binding protein YlxR (DUF448 family)
LLKPRKTPMRMCVGCREMKPKKELLRVVKSPAGTIAFDRVGKAPGRGAYVCPAPECMKKAQKSKALDRALEAQVSKEVYDTLLGQLGGDA